MVPRISRFARRGCAAAVIVISASALFVAYVSTASGSSSTTRASARSSAVPAAALSTCGMWEDADYTWPNIPDYGSNSNARLVYYSGALYDGHSNAWVGVQNDAQTGAGSESWIQGGIVRWAQPEKPFSSTAPALYLEVSTTSPNTYAIYNEGPATSGTPYNAFVFHISPGVWTASIAGINLPSHVTMDAPMQSTSFYSEETLNEMGTCNAMNNYFSNTSTPTSSMTKYSDAPYVIDSVTSNSWHAHN